MKIQKIMTKFGRQLKDSSPTILTFMGAGGVIATSVLTARATVKALDRIEREKWVRQDQRQCMDELSKGEITGLVWKCYVPAFLVGSATISCIFGANILNKKQQASMISLYTMLDQSYKQYVKAAKEVYGEDADTKIKAQVANDMYLSYNGMSVYSPDLDTASEKVLFYDYQSSRYFESTVAGVINAEYHLNRMWALKGEMSINDFYEYLGIPKIEGWDNLGWADEFAESGFMWIDFDMSKTEIEDGLECYVIVPDYLPEPLGIF